MLILPDRVKNNLISVFTQEPNVEKAILFGSRARGDARDQSDIDLALWGKDIPISLNTKLRDAVGLYQMDIVRVSEIDNESLISSIKQDGIVIYSTEEASSLQ